jgi:hypothetical protein
MPKIENLSIEIGGDMHRIVAVKALAQYRVWIRFSDGVEGKVNLSDLVGKGVFAFWNDSEQFGRVFIDPQNHTLTWPDGIDLCPDTLYQDVTTTKVS